MYLRKRYYGGIDWKDSYSTIKYLEVNGKYDLTENESNECIIEDLMKSYPFANVDKIKNSIYNKEKYIFPLKVIEIINSIRTEREPEKYRDNYENQVTINFTEENFEIIEEYSFGQVICYNWYLISEIDSENVCYIVEEHFKCPHKGISIVQRFYHEVFTEKEDALKYLEIMNNLKALDKQNFILLIYDYKKIINTDWFKLNMESINLMKEKNVTRFDESFSLFPDIHLKNLKKIK